MSKLINQKISTENQLFKKLYNFLNALTYVVAIYTDIYLLERPKNSRDYEMMVNIGGPFKYLTFLNLLLQCGYFLLSMLNDFVGSNEIDPSNQTSLQKVRDWIFSSIALPIGVVVSVLFWGIYMVDRELIFPSSMDSWFPGWLNHIMHTLPIAGVFVEVVLTYHQYQTTSTRYLPVITCYVLYVSWLCYIAYFGGFWVYPVFEAMELPARTVFLAFLSIPPVIFYMIGEKVHYTVWGDAMKSVMKPKTFRSKFD